MPGHTHKSLSIGKEIIQFMKDYLEKHRLDRLAAGKDDSMASIIREAMFLWAKEHKVEEDLKKFLTRKQ